MKEPGWKRYLLSVAGMAVLLAGLCSCEKQESDLLDPGSAGAWIVFNTSDGLADNFVLDVEADAQNNIWAACYGYGASRYHNGSWETFNTSNSGILSDWVTCFEPTPNGGMWIGTDYGLCRRSENGNWAYYLIDGGPILSINTIKRASDGTIWIGTWSDYILSLEDGQFRQYIINGHEKVNAIEEDSRGNLWFGTDSGLVQYDGSGWSVFTTDDGLPASKVYALCYDSQDRLWIGTGGGLRVSYIDRSEDFHDLSLMTGAYGTFVRDILEDRKGDIWFATWLNGLVRYDGVIPQVYEDYNSFNYHIERFVNCIGEDLEGNLWFGMSNTGLVKHTLSLD